MADSYVTQCDCAATAVATADGETASPQLLSLLLTCLKCCQTKHFREGYADVPYSTYGETTTICSYVAASAAALGRQIIQPAAGSLASGPSDTVDTAMTSSEDLAAVLTPYISLVARGLYLLGSTRAAAIQSGQQHYLVPFLKTWALPCGDPLLEIMRSSKTVAWLITMLVPGAHAHAATAQQRALEDLAQVQQQVPPA